MFRYLFSVISFLFIIISPCVANIASSEYVDEMRDNIQAKIDKKANNDNYTQNMVLQTDNSGNVVATTVGTDLFADGAIETIHLADGAVTNADLAGMIDITKLNLGTLPTSGKHMMIWNAETNEYVFERYVTSILPKEYTQLEYIKSTGMQYINIPEYFSNIDEMQAEVAMKEDLVSSQDKYFIAPETWNYNNRFALGGFHRIHPDLGGLTGFNFAYGNTSTSNTSYIVGRDNDFHIYHYIDKTFSMMDLGITQDVKNIRFAGNTDNLRLFYGFNSPTKCEIKYIWHKRNGEHLYYLIPAKRNSDGEIGMYDTVTQTFFTNAGTGSFVAGPEI